MNTPLQIHTPDPPLSGFIEMMWHWDGYHPPHPRERILPTGLMELTVNLCDEPLTIYHADNPTQPQHLHGLFVVGAHSEHFIVDTDRPASLLSAWFKPDAGQRLLGLPSAELRNQHVMLTDIWGSRAMDLYHRLLYAHTVAERFAILEAALLAELMRSRDGHQAVGYALNKFVRIPQPQSIAAVAEAIALSQTRFIQVFRQEVGMTPKQFCRVKRFQGAIQELTRTSTPDYGDIALACGYYDQAHFINEFKAFSGLTPSQYTPQNVEHPYNLPVLDDSN